jgi:hypothetical protein
MSGHRCLRMRSTVGIPLFLQQRNAPLSSWQPIITDDGDQFVGFVEVGSVVRRVREPEL